jgi:putative peptidoglycan binding protein
MTMTTPSWWSETMLPGGAYPGLDSVQLALRLKPTGKLDEATRKAVAGVQYVFSLPQTGCVDEPTAQAIGELAWYRGYQEEKED